MRIAPCLVILLDVAETLEELPLKDIQLARTDKTSLFIPYLVQKVPISRPEMNKKASSPLVVYSQLRQPRQTIAPKNVRSSPSPRPPQPSWLAESLTAALRKCWGRRHFYSLLRRARSEKSTPPMALPTIPHIQKRFRFSFFLVFPAIFTSFGTCRQSGQH